MESDFRIKLSTTLDKKGALNDYEQLKKECENQKINLKINVDSLNESLKSIENTFKKAFQFDTTQISNLNKLKDVITEINSLSKEMQKNLFGSSTSANINNKSVDSVIKESAKVKELESRYERLKAVQTSLKTQLAKTWQTDSYNEVLGILNKINGRISSTRASLKSLGDEKYMINVDEKWSDKLTENFANAFQSLQKGALGAHQSLEKYLSMNNLGKEEKKVVNSMLGDLERLESKDFKSSTTYKTLRDWLVTLEDVKAKAKDLKIDISYNDASDKQMKSLLTDYQRLKSEASNLEVAMSKMTFGSEQYKEYSSQLKKVNQDIKTTVKGIEQLKEVSNINLKVDNGLRQQFSKVFTSIDDDIQRTKGKLQNLSESDMTKTQRNSVDKLISKLKELDNVKLSDLLEMDKPYEELAKMDRQIQKVKSDMESISINIKETKSIPQVQNEIQKLTDNLNKLKNEGYGDNSSIDKLLNSLTKMSKIDFNNVSSNKFANTINQLSEIDNEYKKLKSDAEVVKNSMNIDSAINSAVRQASQLASQYEKLGLSTSGIETIITNLKQLDRTDLGNARKNIREMVAELDNMKTAIAGSSANDNGLAEEINKYKSLSNEITTIQKDMSKLTFNSNGFKEFQNILMNLRDELNVTGEKIKSLGGDINSISAGNSNKLQESFIKQLNNIDKSAKEVESRLKSLFKENLTSGQKEQVESLVNAYKQLQNVSIKDLNTEKPEEDIARLNQKLSEFKTNCKNLSIDIKLNSIDQVKNSIENAINGLEKLNRTTKGLNSESINQLINKFKELKEQANLGNLDDNGLRKLQEDCLKLQSEMQGVVTKSKEMKDISDMNISLDNLITQLNNVHNEFEKLGRDTSEIKEVTNALKELDRTDLSQMSAGIQKGKESLASYKSSQSEISTTNKGIRKSFSDLYDTVQGYSIGAVVGNVIMSGTEKIKETLVDLDQAFVNFKKVAPDSIDVSAQAMDNLQQKAIEAGKAVASSSVDIINESASAMQSGIKNVNDAVEYAKNVTMYSNVGDVDIKDADHELKAIMSTWGGVSNALKPVHEQIKNASADYSTMTKYLDLANYAGNNFAVTSADIGEAYARCASILKNNKVSMQDGIALIVGANEPAQNASKVGNALKTMSANLTGVMYSAKNGQVTLSKVGSALKDIAKIDVFDKQTGQIKSQMDILTELHSKWGKLSEAQKQALSSQIAGKQYNNIFQGMMNNWDSVIALQKQYKEGMTVGSAEQENARYVDSLTGRIKQFQEAMKGLLTNTVTNNFAKNIVSFATSAVSGLDNVLNSLNKVGASTPVAIGALTSIVALTKRMADADYTPIKSVSELFTKNGFLSGVSSFRASLSYMKDGVKDLASHETTSGLENIKQGFTGMGSALSGIKSVGLELLSSAITTLGIALAGYAIDKGIEAISNKMHELDNEVKHLSDSISKHNQKIKELNANKNAFKDYAETYVKLSQKTKLSTDETEKLKTATEGLAKLMPDLVVGYDENGDPILKQIKSVDELIRRYDALIKKEKEEKEVQQNKLAIDARKWFQNEGQTDTSEYKSTTSNADTLERAREVNAQIISMGNATSKNFDDWKLKIQKSYDDWNTGISTGYEKVVKAVQKESKHVREIQQGVVNQLSDNTQFKKLSNSTKSVAEDVTRNLNFKDLSSGQISTYINSITKTLKAGKGEAYDAIQQYSQLRENLENTGDVGAYTASIETLIPELAKATGLTQDQVRAMTQLDASYTTAKDALDNFLRGHGYTEAMTSWSKGAQDLQYQFEQLDASFNALSDLEINADGKINAKLVWNVLDAYELPKNLETLIKKICGGNANGEITPKQLQVVQQLLFAFETNDTDTLKTLEKQLKKTLGKKTMKKLFPNGLNLGTVETNFKVDYGDKEFKAIKQTLEKEAGLNNSKAMIKLKAKIETDVANKDLKSLEKHINSIKNKDLKKKVIMDTASALQSLDTIDGYNLADKLLKIFGYNQDALDKYNTVNNQSDIIKNEKINGDNSDAQAKYNSILALPVINKTVNFVAKLVGDAWNTGGKISKTFSATGGGHLTKKSIGVPYNISDTPMEMDETATNSTQISTQSLSATPVGTPSAINVNPTTTIGKVKALSSGLSDVLGGGTTTKAPSIEVSITAKDVSKSLKNDIELLGQLNNALDLMDSKLSVIDGRVENSFGTKKAENLKKAISLLKNQNKLYEQQYKYLDKERKVMQSDLKKNGFKFDKNGNITNYEKKLIAIEDRINALDKQSEKSSSSSSKSSEAKQKKIDKEKESLEQLKKELEKYDEIQTKSLNETVQKWDEAKQKIMEYNQQLEQVNLDNKIYKANNEITKMEEYIKALQNDIDLFDAKLETSKGSVAISLMQTKLESLNKEMENYKKQYEDYQKVVSETQKSMSSYGFKFDENNNISNVNDVLNKYQNKNELSHVKELVENYQELLDNVQECKKNVVDVDNNIINLNKDLEIAIDADKVYKFNSALEEQEKKLNSIENKISLVNAELEYSFGTDKVNNMKALISLYNEGIDRQNESIENLKKMDSYYAEQLNKRYGFTFNDENGDITNLDTVLNKYKDSDKLEAINEELETFYDIHNSKLPEAIQKMAQYQNDEKKAYEDELQLVSDIETKITNMYKDNLDKKKQAIQDQSEAEVKAINKVKDAYSKQKESDTYQADLEKQQKVITDLQEKIELAKRDNSNYGQSQLATLQDQMVNEQKTLQDLMNNRKDTLINEMLDAESTRVQEESDNAVKQLEKTWDTTKIADMVQQSLGTGLFTDIDGNVTNLQDALINFSETSGEAIGALGDKIKTELVGNLQTAYDYIQDYDNIYNKLGLSSYGNSTSYSKDTSDNSKTLNVGGITVNIDGSNIDEDSLVNTVKTQVDEYMKDIINRI